MRLFNYFFCAVCALSLLASCEEVIDKDDNIIGGNTDNNDNDNNGDNNGNNTPEEPDADILFVGVMEVDQNDGTIFTKEAQEVTYKIDDEGVMNIEMRGAKFAAAMPLTLDMTIPGVGYTETTDGYVLEAESIVPLAMGGEFAQFTITNLTGTITDTELTMEFMCGAFPVTYTGTKQLNANE